MNITVRLFATLKDLAKTNQISLSLPQDATIDTVRTQVIIAYPSLAQALPNAIAAVNHEYVFQGHPIADKDEIAFFPPVSGGSAEWPEVYLLAEQPIDLSELTAQIVTPSTGAVTLFSGYVRGETHQANHLRQTSYLEYEAYPPMAYAKMKQVADEIRQKWPLIQGIAIVQRVGHLNVGEPTVLIACAAGHRDHGGFEATHYGIDRLKEIVPVWKKEHGPAGQQWVEGHYHPSESDRLP